ncbi:leucine--tRNA ligase [Methanosarcinales archaeon]|nr:MAG: leucine--tRNA ligase [Methanosarcinales archaeon]
MNVKYDPCMIENKWQKAWDDSGIFQPEMDLRQKFFITVPYPYMNGNLHVGHTRTFTIGDVIARYKRMQGYNVLYPMGFHVTGTPIVGLAELIAKKDKQTMEVYHRFHDIPLNVLSGLNEPLKIVEYFSREAEADMRSIGYSIDWRRRFTTTDPSYKQFITWQFNLLRELGCVVKGSHPVRWCPNDDNPVEDHDILKGEEATIIDYTLIKFKLEGSSIILPCATLRPETVFGVTNLWVNPEVTHVQIEVVYPDKTREEWIVSRDAYEKLRFTDKRVSLIKEVAGEKLIGKHVTNPINNTSVLILPASFVNPENGSGVVMSVPAHAPYDYLALRDLYDSDLSQYGINEDLRSKIKFISLIRVPGFGKYPAVEAVEQLGVENQEDPGAEEATKIVYRREFHSGELTDTTGKYAGTKVSKIKDILTHDLINSRIADLFYEFSSQPVICRCGTRCVVNIVKNQWFLNYSNPGWKEKVYRCLKMMDILPPELHVEFENKVDWLKDKACARRKGLGTNLPWDKQWLIESLGDSTIYMSYYIIAKFIADGITPEQLTEAFFNYVLLGKGDVDTVSENTGITEETLESIRNDINYWYPVDMRSSGKDLIPNHLLFFLFHHTAIFPEDMWPRAITINGFVSLERKKMSKSKGPLLTMKKAVKEYGADITRLYILAASEHTQDADWRENDIETTKKQLGRFYRTAREIIALPAPTGDLNNIDRWLLSRLQHKVAETNDALQKLQTRRALQNSFYLILNDLKWYERRGGKKALPQLLHTWTRLLTPFIPHICEEIWEYLGEGFISQAPYPAPDPTLIDDSAERAEEYLQKALEDVEEILRVTGITPQKIIIYTTPQWKKTIHRIAVELKLTDTLEMKNVMSEAMKDSEVKKHRKEAPKYVQKIITELKNTTKEIAKLQRAKPIIEEEILSDARGFLEKELNCKIEIQSADKPDYDPQQKSRHAEPMRPAIYIMESTED